MPAHPRHPHRLAAALLLAAALPLAACSSDAPLSEPGPEVVGGAAAPDESVTEDVAVSAVQLAFPQQDGLWAEGADVPLYAAISNTGSEPVRLTEIRGEDFTDARLIAADGTDGALEVAGNDTLYLEPDGAPSVLLVNIDRSLRSSQSIPITFVFEDAGEVTIDAPVAAESPADGEFSTPQDPTPDD